MHEEGLYARREWGALLYLVNRVRFSGSLVINGVYTLTG